MLSEQQVRVLLDRLCVRLGFCLPPDDYARLMSSPPDDPTTFTDEVFRAEGLTPVVGDLYRQVRSMVVSAFREAESSGPPFDD
jgi:hypothetical protein